MIELYLDDKLFSGTEEEFLAVEEFDFKEWRLNDVGHRENGPAIIGSNGFQVWAQYGKNHRTDGPAVIDPEEFEEWFQNDLYHRTNGPAVIFSDGTEDYWINENYLSDLFPMDYWFKK